DHLRGEPRGKKRQNADPAPTGDCVDCHRCINVCPTVIDIRNGIQLECVACSACIDACDDIMAKLKRPPGLIRYDSRNGIETQKRRLLRPRLYLYGLFTLLGALVLLLTLKSKARPFHAEVSRLEGTNYLSTPQGVRNIYTIRLTNKRQRPVTFHIHGQGSAEITYSDTVPLTIPPLGTKTLTISAATTAAGYDGSKDITFQINADDGSAQTLNAKFTGPNKHMYRQNYQNQP
ncbi:MAG: 4Fe-4S dicluster domain-containing protein, partial [Verrucomicrobiales bacterium]